MICRNSEISVGRLLGSKSYRLYNTFFFLKEKKQPETGLEQATPHQQGVKWLWTGNKHTEMQKLS